MHLALFYIFQKCSLTGQDTDAVRQCFVAYFMFWERIFISTLWPRFWNSCQFHKQQQLCAKRRIELLRIKVPYGEKKIYMERGRECVCMNVWGKRRNEGVIILLLLFVLLNTSFIFCQCFYHYCVLHCFHAKYFFPSVFLFKIHELMFEVFFPYALVVLFFPYVNNIIKVEKTDLFQIKESQS